MTTPRPRVLTDAADDTIAYVRRHRGMAACYLSVVVLGLFGQPVFSLVIVFAEEVFRVGGLEYGLLKRRWGSARCSPLRSSLDPDRASPATASPG